MKAYRSSYERKLCAHVYLIFVYALKNVGPYQALPEIDYTSEKNPFLSILRIFLIKPIISPATIWRPEIFASPLVEIVFKN